MYVELETPPPYMELHSIAWYCTVLHGTPTSTPTPNIFFYKKNNTNTKTTFFYKKKTCDDIQFI